MAKKLKIYFSGICTYASTVPDANDNTFERLFVIAPRARIHRPTLGDGDQKGIVARHRTFVSVPTASFDRSAQPVFSVVEARGDRGVFLVNNARLALSPAPAGRCKYFTVPDTEVFGWPSTDGSAPANDSRWVPSIAEIFPEATPRLAFDPREDISNDKVGMIVEITGALLEASVPCTSAQPKTFPGTSIPARVMSVDLVATVEYPDETERVTLTITRLDDTKPATGIGPAGLELKWPAGADTMTLRMGNDTLDEVVLLGSTSRCTPDADVDIDFDFDLHYDILTNVTTRPLPDPSGYEGDWGGCVGLKVPTP
jgi:hypothetical protein